MKRMFWNILGGPLDQTPERTDLWRARTDLFSSLMTHSDDTGVEEAYGTPVWVGASEPQDLAPGSIYLPMRGVVDGAPHRSFGRPCRLSF